tara:strand:+ start:260 stop:625 length:366 start_codon:yes stop_codon:yes gene_type:complete
MPTHVEPIVLVDSNEQGIIYRVVSPAFGPIQLNKGFYRIAMGSGCYGVWGLGFTPTAPIADGCVIGANQEQIIYVPEDNTDFACLEGTFTANTGELSINPLLVWDMPGNYPPAYSLYLPPS